MENDESYFGYERVDSYNQDDINEISSHYRRIIELMG